MSPDWFDLIMATLVMGRSYVDLTVLTCTDLTSPSGPENTLNFVAKLPLCPTQTVRFASISITVSLIFTLRCWVNSLVRLINVERYSLLHRSQNCWYMHWVFSYRSHMKCGLFSTSGRSSTKVIKLSPMRKWAGVKAVTSCGSSYAGANGFELRQVSIWPMSVVSSE